MAHRTQFICRRLPSRIYLLVITALFVFVNSQTRGTNVIAEEFRYPIAVAHTSEADFVVDLDLPGVLRLTAGSQPELFCAGAKRFRQPLNRPRCIAIAEDGTVLVGDSAARDVFVVTKSEPPKPLTGGKVGIPMSLAIWKDHLFVADLETRHLLKFPLAGGEPEMFAKLNARGIFADGERLWVVTQEAAQVVTVDETGKVTEVVPERAFAFPHNVVVIAGTAYVSDGYGKAIWQIKAGEKPEVLVKGEPLQGPVGLAVAGTEILIADPQAKQVFRLNPADKVIKPVL